MKHSILPVPAGVKMLRSIDVVLTTTPPSLPDPLEIRRAQLEDADKIADLCGRSYIGEVWDTKSTEIELFQDKTVKAVLLVTDNSRLVATASLQVRTDSPYSGQIRWVATAPDMRRQGLANFLVVRLLEIAATEGCKNAYLKTTTDALGAITLYLKLGFRPMIDSERERSIWSDVFRTIGVDPCF